MYADDIILISNYHEGLQNCLNKLHNYCNKWKLKVNIVKSKVIVFNKTGRMSNDVFRYGNNIVESVRNYKYLGIEFSISGIFTEAKNNLKSKAMKSTFMLKSIISNQHLSPSVALNLFKKLIIPIGVYGAEIWGAFCNLDICKAAENLPFEKVLLNYGKYILGVNRKACNAGVRGDLGLYPAYINVILSVFKYASRLHKLPAGSLLKAAYTLNIEMDKTGVKSWYTGFKHLLQNITDRNENDIHNMSTSEILELCKHVFVNNWHNTISRDTSKLKLYSDFKSNIFFEQYLNDVNNFKFRQSLTKVRISAHQLEIEKGRYYRPVIARELRLCKFAHKELVMMKFIF